MMVKLFRVRIEAAKKDVNLGYNNGVLASKFFHGFLLTHIHSNYTFLHILHVWFFLTFGLAEYHPDICSSLFNLRFGRIQGNGIREKKSSYDLGSA